MENPESQGTDDGFRALAEKHTKPAAVKPKGKKSKKAAAVVSTAALLRSPEVKAIIAQAVAAATEQAIAETRRGLSDAFAVAHEEAGTEAKPGETDVLNRLSATLCEMMDQGQNRAPRIAPEEVAVRAAAREQMFELIAVAVAEELEATYDLTAKVYLGDQIVAPTYRNAQRVEVVQSVTWAEIPNETMVPTNETAVGIYNAFMRSIGGRTRDVRVPYKKAGLKYDVGLRVHGRDTVRETPPVPEPRMGSTLKVHRPGMLGQVAETNVLGTLASPARAAA